MSAFLRHVPKGEYDTLLKNIARVITRPISEDLASPMRQELQKLNWPDAVDVCENLMRMGRTVLSNSLWVVLLEEIEKIKEKYARARSYHGCNADGIPNIGDKEITSVFLKTFMSLFNLNDGVIFLKLNKRLRDINNKYGDKAETKQQVINEMNALYYEIIGSKRLKSTAEDRELFVTEQDNANEFVF